MPLKRKVHAPNYLYGLYFNILFVILFMKNILELITHLPEFFKLIN